MKPTCSICSGSTEVTACESGGYVCGACAETNRVGRDQSTRLAKANQKALRLKADAARTVAKGGEVSDMNAYAIESAELMALDEPVARPPMMCGGEVATQGDTGLLDTLQDPSTVAIDASSERLRLVSQLGTDCTAMALDASDTIKASTSLEKMLGHQLAVCHQMAMDHISKASLQENPDHAAKLFNLSLRAMDTYQRGLLTLKRLRSDGNQSILIRHVSVGEGGQAVIGNIPPRGAGVSL